MAFNMSQISFQLSELFQSVLTQFFRNSSLYKLSKRFEKFDEDYLFEKPCFISSKQNRLHNEK